MKRAACMYSLLVGLFCAGKVSADVVISEFLAVNSNGIRDDDYQRSDWLELYNSSGSDAHLGGWFLTDTAAEPTKWTLPALTVGPNSRVVIWCSGTDRTDLNSPLHTNFKLQKEAGGYLALFDAQTNLISAFVSYPAQHSDVAYGRDQIDPGLTGYLHTPTPGAPNALTGPGVLGPPVISPGSGIFSNATITVTLQNTNGAGQIRYTTDNTVPTASSPLYSEPLILGTNSTIRARVFSNGSLLPSAVEARNYIFLDNTAQAFSSPLPILIISTEGGAIPSDVPPGFPRRKGAMALIDTAQGRSSVARPPAVQTVAEFELFGQTSLVFPKPPIRIELQDAIGNDFDASLLGMPSDADWQLKNPYNDKTYLNDFLGLELWEKMGHYSVRRKFVEVFLDTQGGRVSYPADYLGVMVLCERIKAKDGRVEIPQLTPYATNEPAVTGGYIFKRDKDSMGDLNFRSPGGGAFLGIPLKLHDPRPNQMRFPQGITTVFPGANYTASGSNQLNYLVNYLGQMERALYTNTWLSQTGTNHYSHYLDSVAFADQFLHVEFTKNIDGYRLSSFFTKDRNGKVQPGPVWDWELAFGNADFARGGITNGWYFELTSDVDHPWARRLITGTTSATADLGDPDFLQLIADRWSMFRTNVLNVTNLLLEIDSYATMLSEPAARDLYGKYRNGLIGVYTWPNPSGTGDGRDVDYTRPTNYLGPIETAAPSTAQGSIIGQMKKWLLGRYLWIDSQFATPPVVSEAAGPSGAEVTIVPPPGGTVYYTVDGSDPRLPGGGVSASAFSSSAPVTITIESNIHVVARARLPNTFKGTWSGSVAGAFSTTIPTLRITEIMYHPAPAPVGSTNATSDFEYIEVKNISAFDLPVSGFSISGGVQFQFPNATLAAGESAVIVANVSAFQTRYSANARILGTFSGKLDNGGDCITLLGSLGERIHDFCYTDEWHPTTDGAGFSLVVNSDTAPISGWGSRDQWRPSSAIGGSPGGNDPPPPSHPRVVVNEVLANSATEDADFIELHNASSNSVNISGWFLTDDVSVPKKYQLPAGTMISPYGFLIVNGSSANGFGAAFTLTSAAGEVFIFSGNGADLTGYGHGFSFGASSSNSSFGRHVISNGDEYFVRQAATTMGGVNAGPAVGPIVISEILPHPIEEVWGISNKDDEFIELYNITGNTVALQEAGNGANTWRLTGAIEFTFPPGVSLAPGAYLLVVGFDPSDAAAAARFRSDYNVSAGTPLYGPWAGDLNDMAGSVELVRPDSTANGYVLVEEIDYTDALISSPSALGIGLSLQRVAPSVYGNDPTNWQAGAASPGGSLAVGGSLPAITGQPGSQLLVYGSNVVLAISASGTAPLRYQWKFNGVNLLGATTSTLAIPNFQVQHAGTYSVVVYNGSGYTVSSNFTLAGRAPLAFVLQPEARTSVVGTTTNFSALAIGDGPVRYQWYFAASPIPDATNSTLIIPDLQFTHGGTYHVVATDRFVSVTSQVALLNVVTPPVRTIQPVSMTVVEGTDVALSVAAEGSLPISFRWRTNGFTVTGIGYEVSSPSNSTLVITNVSTNLTGVRFSVAITNLGGSASLTTNAILTVLADSDRDGLPDVWESGRLGFDPANPADGSRDDDGDGMSNRDEYYAGTDPFDLLSFLQIHIAATNRTISFMAVSNRAYRVLYSETLGGGWNRLADILARDVTRIETISDATVATNRFYRLVTPPHP